MKFYNLSNRCNSGMLTLALLVATAPLVSAQTYSAAFYKFYGPNGDFRAHVGDTVTFEAGVVKWEDMWGNRDSLFVNSVFLVIHHGTGDVAFPNLAGTGFQVPFPDFFAFFTTNVTVQPEDGDDLSMDCAIQWNENSTLPISQVADATYGDSVLILKPAVEIFHQPRVSPAFPSIAFDGMVTNTGNTPLYDLDIVSDSGTPQDTSDDVAVHLPVLDRRSALAFSGTYMASGAFATNTVTVRGADALGLVVGHSSTRAIPVALSIARSGASAIQLSWPAWAEGYRLESCGAVGETWKTVNAHPVLTNGKLVITLPMTTNQIYQLVVVGM